MRDVWRELVLSDSYVGTSYARRLIARIVVSDDEISIEAPSAPSENAPP